MYGPGGVVGGGGGLQSFELTQRIGVSHLTYRNVINTNRTKSSCCEGIRNKTIKKSETGIISFNELRTRCNMIFVEKIYLRIKVY